MPRLPAAGASIAGTSASFDTEYPSAVTEDKTGTLKMLRSQTIPNLGTAGSSPDGSQPAWQSASMRADVEGIVDPERVQLPPLAKSR